MDVIKRVQTLMDKHTMLLDIRLYTPTTEDYKKCPSSTLKCFAEEIKVLGEELKTFGRIYNFKLNIKLEKLATFFNETETACRQCELFIEQNAANFLSDLMSTLQMMNQQFCE
ncbi:interleukin 15, like isoform X2 [Paralichthys olivaceus]